MPCSTISSTRRDLDAARIGMWGVSLGGYYAPRAAAFDKRIKACIALGGPFNWAEAWDGLPELTREAFRVRSHCKTDEEARKNAATLSLEGVAQNITCPIFIVNGRLDRLVPAKDAERLAREVKGPVELMMIEDGNHIATNRAYRWRSQSADWMAERAQIIVEAARDVVQALDSAVPGSPAFRRSARRPCGRASPHWAARPRPDRRGTAPVGTGPAGRLWCSRAPAADSRRRSRAADRR